MQMSKTICLTLWLIVFLNVLLNAQARFTISGTITDKNSGEILIGATIYSLSIKQGAISNEYGFYSLTLAQSDTISLLISYIGYEPYASKLVLNKNYTLNIQLQTHSTNIDEISVIGNQDAIRNVDRAQMGIITVPIEKIKSLPAIIGESDVLKVVQLLPGVQPGNEGTTGFFVRGGNADQNLVMLDEAVIYNPNHMFGLFSTFNPNAINNMEFIKGGIPAYFGGRLSSIVDVKMKEGNLNKYEVQGGIGLISSQLTVEGPIKKQKASFILSGRSTYLNLLLKPFMQGPKESKYRFYDLNGKINWQISSKDRLYFSAFLGKDDAEYTEDTGISYKVLFGNSAATLRWNHIFSPKHFLKTSIIYNTYLQDITTIQDKNFQQTYAGINDITIKTELQYYPYPRHIVRAGIEGTVHRFLSLQNSGIIPDNNKVPEINAANLPSSNFNEFAFYINDEYKMNNSVSLNYGIRAPGYSFASTNYFRVEPRATIKVGIDSNSSLKASFTQINQFLHLVSASNASLPTDIWVPSTQRTKPQSSIQYAIGYYRNFKNNLFESSVELYYKKMDNQVLFAEGTQTTVLTSADSMLVYGEGESYGAEFFLKKNYGRLTGWISYTLSWTNQKFEDLNFGEEFPFKYDRRHILSVVGDYEINKKWSVSAIFTLSSGMPYTVPTGRVNAMNAASLFEGSYYMYEGRNNTRLAPYHRLDLSASRKQKHRLFKKTYDSEWVFGIYNVYSRQNPYFVYLTIDHNTNEPVATQVSLLPIIPSVTYKFKF